MLTPQMEGPRDHPRRPPCEDDHGNPEHRPQGRRSGECCIPRLNNMVTIQKHPHCFQQMQHILYSHGDSKCEHLLREPHIHGLPLPSTPCWS